LPQRADGQPELVDSALPTLDVSPPLSNSAYTATVRPVPADVLARGTWQPGCPVAADALRYLTMSFWGFDGLAHTGEMLLNASLPTA
jgi:hypothetical protein